MLRVIAALRDGDEEAFTRLVDQHHAALRRIARLYVSSPAVADEVVQETWLAVIQGVWAFQGRSSLRTWILRILINRAKTRARREGRTVPFADAGVAEPVPVRRRATIPTSAGDAIRKMDGAPGCSTRAFPRGDGSDPGGARPSSGGDRRSPGESANGDHDERPRGLLQRGSV